MSNYLVTRCKACGAALDAIRAGKSPSLVGEFVNQAAANGLQVDLVEDASLGECGCPKDESITTEVSDKATARPFRWTIRQLLFLTAVIGVLLVVFRNPLSMMFGVENHALAWMPWHFYLWLFGGIPMPSMKKGPPAGADIVWFSVNICLAAIVGFYVVFYSIQAVCYGWRKVSE